MRDAWPSGLRNRSSRELLQLYAATLSILLERGVIRTRNAPAGDLAERLVADAYGAHLLPNSVKSYDVLTQDGQRIQVKCRVLESTKGSQTYSVFRSWEFDRCVFVRFDPVTYDVLDAVDVPVTSVKPIAKHVAWVKGDRVAVAAPLLSLPDARDVSQDLQAALERLDSAPRQESPGAAVSLPERPTRLAAASTQKRIAGCLLAGAVGDALGASIEFDSWGTIRARFGERGLTGYAPAYGRSGGAITDDTQMTLFTADGLIRAVNRWEGKGVCSARHVVHHAYLCWLATQGTIPRGPEHDGWLIEVPELWSRRAPGNTCLSALRSGQIGGVDEPINDSKGCGGVMRAAPAGLVAEHADRFRFGCDVAAITHGHPDGYLPAGVLAVVVGSLVDGADLSTALDTAEARLRQADNHETTLAALRAGRALGTRGLPTPEKLESLGGGWVGEEALAIAVACAVSGFDQPVEAMLASVNHSGDSDPTGSIAGNILGAAHGVQWLPQPWLEGLELRDVVEQMSMDLHRAFHVDRSGEAPGEEDSGWRERYPGW